ncbi:MAG: hypothetical protein V5A24_08200 [Haloarculaceae archaeon]
MVPSPSGRILHRPSAPSRRSFLQASGLTLASGLAGCALRQRGSGTTSTASGTATPVPPDASYDLTIENGVAESDLEPVDGLSSTTPVSISVDVEKNYDDREDEILFERSVELAPETNRTFGDAFSTDPDGPEYVVAAEFEPLQERDESGAGRMSLTSAARFEPGGFGAPTRPEFFVVVMDGEQGEKFEPYIVVRNERPRRR